MLPNYPQLGHNGGPRLMATNFGDALAANMGFLVSQTSHIEPTVYRMRFPEYDYMSLVPVDTSAHPWAKTVTYFSTDAVGEAKFLAGFASDVPTVGTSFQKSETDVHMAGIGYDYGLEEIEQARMQGIGLENEKIVAARRAYEVLCYNTAMTGQAQFGWEGLFNHSTVPTETIPADGTGSSALWADKTPDLIIRDMNQMLTGLESATNFVEMANTLVLPRERFQYAASTRLTDTTDTVLSWFMRNNVYTAQTSQPIRVVGKRGLLAAGAGSTARMIAYRNASDVLKLHMPLPHQFLPPRIEGLRFLVPGIFRLGGVDVRLPYAMRYGDGI